MLGAFWTRDNSAGTLQERLLNDRIVEPVEWRQDARDALKDCGDVTPKRTAQPHYACAECRPGTTPSG